MEDIKINKIKKFVEFWTNKGDEKGESQKFWLHLLRDVLDVENPVDFITFESRVKLSNTSFIDGYIDATHVMIEQKSQDKDLSKPIPQSDGTMLTPYQQARRYAEALPYSQRPRWIIICNFQEFRIYDMENPQAEPEIIQLQELPKEYYRLEFIANTKAQFLQKEMELSLQAGEIVGQLYKELLKQYHNPEDVETLQQLNILCVRLVFCLYAEDTGLFGKHNMFHDYLKEYKGKNARRALEDLFHTLNTPYDQRDPYLDEDLAKFPYVNGGLFANDKIVIPTLSDDILDLLLEKASLSFDWSGISPTIFGAVFESTLNPETRRSGGMHYTSIENIHKVIDPLFLDDLTAEFETIKTIKVAKVRKDKLEAFQNKLASLKFLDPACGSGNFLTETYISLRLLENQVIRLIYSTDSQGALLALEGGDHVNPIKVSISQFYGIEINDFAVTVARTAMWIAESQMMKETESILNYTLDFFPLKTYVNIVEANALRIDWNEVVDKNQLNYIMGNPPFVGYALQSKEQKKDLKNVLVDLNNKEIKNAGKVDYVIGWYYKAARMMYFNKNITSAFVSTNSITQGEQVTTVWKPLYESFNINISFAHTSFKWANETMNMAGVWCVIIGFCSKNNLNQKTKFLYYGHERKYVSNISPYLLPSDTIFIESRRTPLINVLKMRRGNQPTDGGNLIMTYDEMKDFVKKEPQSQKYIKKFSMGEDYIKSRFRYCLWLDKIPPQELTHMPLTIERVNKVKSFREQSTFAPTREMALTPTLFREQLNPKHYLALPKVSSCNRRYVPIGYLNDDVIPGDKLQIIIDADLYYLGIMTSNVHMSWMRCVGGRLGMGYSYVIGVVYNTFPWPNPTPEQKAKIEETAQGILDARNLYPDCSLADLYNELTMPPELRKAHQANDKAVMAAYGFSTKMSEAQCVAELMKMYQELVQKLDK